MQPVFTFDEVHAVSDLHLGGAGGFQIFGRGAELAALVDHLATAPGGRRVALVVNGDFVDFLAEEPARTFDPDGAVAKLDRIAADPAFAPVFAALGRFVATPGRTLVVNLGNHDVELALPWVRARLVSILAGDDPARAGRIAIVADGTGVSCTVGAASVLCVHGNEVDDWNVVDHEAVRRVARERVQGGAGEPLPSNAGSHLVVDVMNPIKRRFAFVDLLKPEIRAVVPALLALDPGLARRIPRLAPIVARRVRDRLRMAMGFLGDEDVAAATVTVIPVAESAGGRGGPRPRHTAEAKRYADGLLDDAEERFRHGDDPVVLLTRDQQEAYLDVGGAIHQALCGDRVEALREALEGIDRDRALALDDADAACRALDARVGRDVDFLVAGHTHLPRALRRPAGNGWYFNSGTWARTIRLSRPVLESPAEFKRVFATLETGRVDALDAHPGLVGSETPVVSIRADGDGAVGELRHFVGGTGDVWKPVPGAPVARS